MRGDRGPHEMASRALGHGIAKATTGQWVGRQMPSLPSHAGIAHRPRGFAWAARWDRVGHTSPLRGSGHRTSQATRYQRRAFVSGSRPDVRGTRGKRADLLVAGSHPRDPTYTGTRRPVVRMAKVTYEDRDPHTRGSKSSYEMITNPSCEDRDPSVRASRSSLVRAAIPR